MTKNGILQAESKNRLVYILGMLRDLGYEVFNAIETEEWGKSTPSATNYTSRDFDELKDSNYFLAFLGDSHGVSLEIGWASALNKKILICKTKDNSTTPLIEGIQSFSNTQILFIDNEIPSITEWDNKLFHDIKNWLG